MATDRSKSKGKATGKATGKAKAKSKTASTTGGKPTGAAKPAKPGKITNTAKKAGRAATPGTTQSPAGKPDTTIGGAGSFVPGRLFPIWPRQYGSPHTELAMMVVDLATIRQPLRQESSRAFAAVEYASGEETAEAQQHAVAVAPAADRLYLLAYYESWWTITGEVPGSVPVAKSLFKTRLASYLNERYRRRIHEEICVERNYCELKKTAGAKAVKYGLDIALTLADITSLGLFTVLWTVSEEMLDEICECSS